MPTTHTPPPGPQAPPEAPPGAAALPGLSADVAAIDAGEGHAGPCVCMPADVVRVRIAWVPTNPDPENPMRCRCGATEADPYCFCGC